MTPLLISSLITQVGLPLAQQLIALYHAGNAPVTADQWASLQKLAAYSPDDALKAVGLKLVDGKLVAALNALAQVNEAISGLAPIAQVGFGGALLVIVVRWLSRVEAGLAGVEHAMRGLSKAIWMDLAERATPGSFIREEAKRTLQQMEDRERGEEEVAKRRGREP